MIRLGDLELHVVSGGTFRLDGGAMFGIVPRPVWERRVTPDEQNRILLSLNLMILRGRGRILLVETGLGERRDDRFEEMYAIRRPEPLLAGLDRLGIRPAEVDQVILTHLHFDHAGGATLRRGERTVPTFPRADFMVQEGALEEARRDNPRTRGSYHVEDFLPVVEAGQVKFVKGDSEVAPGVRVLRTGGHVDHHQMVWVERDGRKALFWGDLLPTAAHVKPAWVTGYDLYPAEVASLKAELLGRAADEEWLNVFGHDPQVAVGVIRRDGKEFRVETVEEVPGTR